MTNFLPQTAKSARRRFTLAATLLGVIGLIAVAGLNVLAATKPGFKLTVTPATQTVTAGDTAAYSIAVTRSNKFTSPITLSANGLPSATKTFTPNPIPGSGNASTLQVATDPATTPGTYQLTISGAGGGASNSTTVSLVVIAPAQPNFALTVSPASRVMTEDDSVSHSVQIERSGGFSGAVALTAADLPKGVTAQFSPNPVPGATDTTDLTLTSDSQAKPGTYALTIRGLGQTGTGATLERTASLILTIEEKKAFSIAGDLDQPVAPGAGAPLDLVLTNPHNFPLSVTEVTVSVEPRTSAPACGGNQNFYVDQIPAERYPITLSAKSTATLTDLGVLDADKPTVRMANLDSNQDACKGVSFSLQYSGSATK